MKVLVLCGGRSAERDISCISAASILNRLDKRHKPELVWIDPKGAWFYQPKPADFAAQAKPERFAFKRIAAHLEPGRVLRAGKKAVRFDVVFPALHGPMGEDGTLQGYLELMGAPYVGCGVFSSALGMDKEATKLVAKQAGLPVLPYVAVHLGREARLNGFKLPVFVKPARLGSSVGVYKVKRQAQLRTAVDKALRFDSKVLIEQGVAAREIECAVLGETRDAKASVVSEIQPNAEFYSYEAKYLDPKGAEFFVPARLSLTQAAEVQRLSLKAFEALGCYGLARVDFFLDKDTGKLWFNEINTMPGFTAVSQYPKMWEASGLPYTKLLDELLHLALRRSRAQKKLRVTR